jgi:hypothetical protein
MSFGVYFMSLFKDVEKVKINKQPIHTTQPVVDISPRTKEKMRKVKSEEDFMKVQVPWIL